MKSRFRFVFGLKMRYTKTNNHNYSFPLAPTHPKSTPITTTHSHWPKTYPTQNYPPRKDVHPPPPPTNLKYTSTHPYPRTKMSTNPHQLKIYLYLSPLSPTFPQKMSTHLDPWEIYIHPPKPTSTHIICPPTPTYSKYTSIHTHTSIKTFTHKKYTSTYPHLTIKKVNPPPLTQNITPLKSSHT